MAYATLSDRSTVDTRAVQSGHAYFDYYKACSTRTMITPFVSIRAFVVMFILIYHFPTKIKNPLLKNHPLYYSHVSRKR